MKSQLNLRLLFGICFIFISCIAIAQPCTETNLAQNIGNRVSGHSNTGQSFTASCSGSILQVTIVWNELPTQGSNSNDRVLTIRDGALCTSPILHQQVIPVSSVVVGANTFTLTTPVPINLAEVNSWEISDSGQTSDAAYGVAHNSGGNYGGGNSWYSCSQLTGFDATFEVLIGIPGPSVNLGADTSLCAGSSLTLNAANPGSSYMWSTGDTSQTITVSTSGTYSVMVTDTGMNTAADTIVVMVNSVPTVNIGPDVSICQGASVTLDAGNPGASYLWSTGDTTQTITANTTGLYAVMVTDSGCTGADSMNLTVNPNPTVNLGQDTTICANQTACLDAGSGGVSYLWSTGATTAQICVGTSGSYAVTCTDANNCSGSDTLTLTVAAPVVVNLGPDRDICTGDSACLSAGSGGVAYLWSTGSTDSSICISVAGMYSVVCTATNGCTGSDSLNLTVSSAPAAAIAACDTSGCPTIVFADGSTGGAQSWLWNFGDGNSSTAQNPAHTYTQPGNYSISLTIQNSCGSDSVTKTLDVQCFVGMDELLSGAIRVYPNPTSGRFKVDFGDLQPAHAALRVFALSGKRVLERSLENLAAGHVESVQLPDLSEGMYYLRIEADGGQVMHRLMVVRD